MITGVITTTLRENPPTSKILLIGAGRDVDAFTRSWSIIVALRFLTTRLTRLHVVVINYGIVTTIYHLTHELLTNTQLLGHLAVGLVETRGDVPTLGPTLIDERTDDTDDDGDVDELEDT